jgi:hypothetical protein
MSEPKQIEARLAKWTAVGIIVTGLVLISIQLGAQVYIDLQAALAGKITSSSSTYVGFVVLLIGAALMAVLSISGSSHAK